MQEVNGVVVYDTIQEIVAPEHSCLVVWDVQNGLVDRIFNKEEFLANLKNLLERLRNKMPVVYTLITPVAKGFDSPWRYFSAMRRWNSHQRPLRAPASPAPFPATLMSWQGNPPDTTSTMPRHGLPSKVQMSSQIGNLGKSPSACRCSKTLRG